MAMEQSQGQDDDLDRTDKLPILQGVAFEFDVEDDAVRLDDSSDRGAATLRAVPGEFFRHSPVDLPLLAETVRSVEARIANQHADYEVLRRSYEQAQAAESAALARAAALEGELAGARTALESEQLRALRLQQSVAEAASAVELARSTSEGALREAERHRAESRTLRDSLAARDATVVQVLHSLGERDAQLTALRAEHAQLLPSLDARARSASQLEGELNAARSRLSALGAALKTEEETSAALKFELRRSEAEAKTLRADLNAASLQTARYLERLRTREWRRGFDQNLFREMDGQLGAADLGSAAVKSERDRLQNQLAAFEAKMAALRDEIAARDSALAEARAATEAERQRAAKVAASLAQAKSQHAAHIADYEAAAETHEQELNVLIVHLQEARRPIEAIVGDVRHLKEELLAKSAAYESVAEELKESRAELERTRGALQEREFLIRRLERSETNNATALGRIQNSMERLGSAVGQPLAPGAAASAVPPSAELPAAPPAAVAPIAGLPAAALPAVAPTPVLAAPPAALAPTAVLPAVAPTTDVPPPVAQGSPAEFIRIGDPPVTHALGRRTRIGRAPSCELQIDAASVSRHHALIVLAGHEAIIEDLNSTNGVLVNGRKVTRQVVSDGDLVTIGDIQFKFAWKH